MKNPTNASKSTARAAAGPIAKSAGKSAAKSYVIFGPGRVGRNMTAYLRYLGHRVRLVSRAEATSADKAPVETAIAEADIVAAAIPDDALSPWRAAWSPAIGARPAMHFSGAIAIDGMTGAHPLYSFPPTELPAADMEKIAFAVEAGGPAFDALIPGAPNPHFAIDPKDRAFYHALAVLSGNFAAHIWNETATAFAERFPASPGPVFAHYLAGVVARFAESPTGSLTGPVARRDVASAQANLDALADEPRLRELYAAFLASAWPDFAAAGGNVGDHENSEEGGGDDA